MHHRLRQDVEAQYTGDEDINTVIAMAERLDSIHRSTGTYGRDKFEKQGNNPSYKKQEPGKKPKKKFNNSNTSNNKKEQKEKGACFTCGGKGHMARDCPSKNDKGKSKVKKETTSNLVEQQDNYDEIYINALEFERYAAAKATRPATIKPHNALEGPMLINGKQAKVLFDTGTIGVNLISAAFVTTHGIPCTPMKEPTKILMAMKGSRSESHKECIVNLSVGKLQTTGNKMLVGNLAKYDALIGIPFLKQKEAIIECGGLTIDFPKHGTRINCTPTSGHIRAAVITTEDIMSQHPEVFPEVIPEGLPPLRKINYEIRLILGKDLGTLPTYSISEGWVQDMSFWIKEKIDQGIIERKAVHGVAPIFAPEKKDNIRMRPLVDLTARNEITIKDDKTIPNQRMILNSLGRARYRSKIDLSDAYFQTRVEPKDVDKKGFKSPFGCFISKVLLQGDMNAPGTFMRIMSDLFPDYLGRFLWVYIDDILIYSDTEEDHLKHISMVCDKLKEARFYASRKKSEIFAKSMDVLGHIIDEEGLKASPEMIARIEAWTTPKNKKQLQEFLGVVNYISQFIPHLASITAPLTSLTGTEEFVWTATHDQAMENVKRAAAHNEIMKPLDHESALPIWLITDVSDTGVGPMVGQGATADTAKLAALYSRKLSNAQMNYRTTDREALVIVNALAAFTYLLAANEFTFVTDHQPLMYLKTSKTPTKKQLRWRGFIGQFRTKIIYRPGQWNYLADALSRLYTEDKNYPHTVQDPTQEDSEDENSTLTLSTVSNPEDMSQFDTRDVEYTHEHSDCDSSCSIHQAVLDPSDYRNTEPINLWGDYRSISSGRSDEEIQHSAQHWSDCFVLMCPNHEDDKIMT